MNRTLRSPLGRTPLPLPDCERCGFTSDLFRDGEVPALLREYAADWQQVLTGPGLDGRRVGTPHWSPLEHGCHVRDMCVLFHTRLDAMLGSAPRPFTSECPDAVHAVHAVRRYSDEEPQQVAREVERAADALAHRLGALTADDWDRADPGLADPRLTVGFFTRHLLHDIAHDLAEVRRGNSEAEQQSGTANKGFS